MANCAAFFGNCTSAHLVGAFPLFVLFCFLFFFNQKRYKAAGILSKTHNSCHCFLCLCSTVWPNQSFFFFFLNRASKSPKSTQKIKFNCFGQPSLSAWRPACMGSDTWTLTMWSAGRLGGFFFFFFFLADVHVVSHYFRCVLKAARARSLANAALGSARTPLDIPHFPGARLAWPVAKSA